MVLAPLVTMAMVSRAARPFLTFRFFIEWVLSLVRVGILNPSSRVSDHVRGQGWCQFQLIFGQKSINELNIMLNFLMRSHLRVVLTDRESRAWFNRYHLFVASRVISNQPV